ncbi:hypothetical protein RI367_008458 [Sorochytrium milnesiophthora]
MSDLAGNTTASTPSWQRGDHNVDEPKPGEKWHPSLGELRHPQLIAVMALSLLVSLTVFIVSVRKAFRQRTRFNFGVVFGCAVLLFNDLWYFSIIASSGSAGSFELVRTVSSVVVASTIAGLSFERFRVFAATQYARWYTNNVRRFLVTLNFVVCLGFTIALLYSYVSPLVALANLGPHATPDERKHVFQGVAYRKPIIITALVFAVGSDLTLTGLTIWIVLKIRRDINRSSGRTQVSSDDVSQPNAFSGANSTGSGLHSGTMASRFGSGNEQGVVESAVTSKRRQKLLLQSKVFRVLISLSSMLTLSLGGIAVYYLSQTVFSDCLGCLFARLYVVAAIIEWYLVVDIVDARNSRKNRRNKRNNAAPASYIPSTNARSEYQMDNIVSMKPTPASSYAPLQNVTLSHQLPPQPRIVSLARQQSTRSYQSNQAEVAANMDRDKKDAFGHLYAEYVPPVAPTFELGGVARSAQALSPPQSPSAPFPASASPPQTAHAGVYDGARVRSNSNALPLNRPPNVVMTERRAPSYMPPHSTSPPRSSMRPA